MLSSPALFRVALRRTLSEKGPVRFCVRLRIFLSSGGLQFAKFQNGNKG